MGTTVGRENSALATPDLWAEPFAFDFIQAVRAVASPRGNRGSVGHDTAPGHEVVRFSAHRDLGFPASQIHDLVPGSPDGENPPLMTVAFIGLTGPSGVLPTHYTELVIEDSGTEDQPGALADFLDMFHHRLISLSSAPWERIIRSSLPILASELRFTAFCWPWLVSVPARPMALMRTIRSSS